MPAHMEGHEGNLPIETQIQSFRVSLMGHWVCQLLVILCIALSLALVSLGGSDLLGGFCLQTLSFGKPHDNHGIHFG
jgi:hypothetical protein